MHSVEAVLGIVKFVLSQALLCGPILSRDAGQLPVSPAIMGETMIP